MKKMYSGLKSFVTSLSLAVLLASSTMISANAAEVEEQVELDAAAEVGRQAEEIQEEQNQIAANESEQAANADKTAKESDDVSSNQDIKNSIKVDSKFAYLVVENYTIDGGLLEAGSNLNVNINLHNISSTVPAENVVITLSSTGGMLYPRYGTDNQIVVGKVLPDEEKIISVPVTVNSKFEGDAVDFTCSFSYTSEGREINNSSTMIITTSTGRSIIVKSIDMSNKAILNGKSLLTVSYANTSNTNINDASLIIDGNVSYESSRILLDSVNAGKSYTEDFNITFTEGGSQEIQMKLAYTDSNGEYIETDLGHYNVMVSDEVLSSSNYNKSNRALFYGGRVLAIISLLIAVSFAYKHFKSK